MSLTRPNFALRVALAALALLMIFTFSTARPVQAETAGQRSTRNIILGAVALTAGIILYNNYHHKQLAHNTIVGYTADGGTVYADGRVVYPDGTVLYTSNNGRRPCEYDGYGVPCNNAVRAYRVARYYNQDQGEDENQDDQPAYNNQDDQSAYNNQDDQRVYNNQDDQPVYSNQDDRPVRYDRDGRRVYYDQNDRQIRYRQHRLNNAYGYRRMNNNVPRHFRNAKRDHNREREN
jgi:hypothetical protein